MVLTAQGYNDIKEDFPANHILEISELTTQSIPGYGNGIQYNGHTYYKSSSKSTWNEAKAKHFLSL